MLQVEHKPINKPVHNIQATKDQPETLKPSNTPPKPKTITPNKNDGYAAKHGLPRNITEELHIKIMELGKITNTCEYFVLITGDTEVHARAIADNIEDKLAAEDITLWHKEGYGNANWILMDYIDVVVHVFKPEKRDYYNLDNLWADAKVKLVRDGVK